MPNAAAWVLLGAFFLSGAAVLGLELVWVRLLGLVLGAETIGVIAVLTGFFGGLALGAATFHQRIVRARRPVLIYAASEIVIAAYGLISLWLLRTLEPVPGLVAGTVGDNQSPTALLVNVGIAAAVLLPATLPMGVTTAAVVEVWRRAHGPDQSHRGVGLLYAANTLGATIGIIGCTYWLVPALGMQVAVTILSTLCLVAGASALAWDCHSGRRTSASPGSVEDADSSPASRGAVHALLFFTGLASIGFEVIGTQVLSQVFENTVHTFANILAVFLVGTSMGAWLHTRPRVRAFCTNHRHTTSALLFGLALSVLVSKEILQFAPRLLSAIAPPDSPYSTYLTAEIVVTMSVFLAPTLLMGATFSHLLGRLAGSGVGYGYAINTFAGALAPLAFGLLMIPRAGYGWTMTSVAGVYAGAFFGWAARHLPIRQLGLAASVLGVGTVVTQSSLVLVTTPPGYQLVAQKQGLFGTVSVSERSVSMDGVNSSRARLLQVNQNFLMGGALGYTEQRIGDLALLLAASPREVLFLGVGTGITAGTALADPGVSHVTAVELVPESLDLLDWFFEFNKGLQLSPRVSLHASDARRFLRATPQSYDPIVGELFHPTVNGAGSLFTREHFAAARRRLRPGGIFVQWLPLYQLTKAQLALVARTFLEVFPDAHSLLGSYGAEAALAVFGGLPDSAGRTPTVDMARVERLFGQARGPREAIDGPADLLAAYMTDSKGLRAFAGSGPLNTDDNQRLLFDAPLSLGGELRATYRSLEGILPFRTVWPAGLLRTNDGLRTSEDWIAATRSRADAVGHFLAAELLRAMNPSELSAAAVARYLDAYRSDLTFTNAAQMLLELAGRHPEKAAEILAEMARANPGDARLSRTADEVKATRDPDLIIRILRDYLLGR